MKRKIWTPEPLFHGATVFLLGGGPTLGGVDLSCLRGRAVIAINSSAALARKFDLDGAVLFFMDEAWFSKHKADVAGWPGPVITCARAAKRLLPDRVWLIAKGERRNDFPPVGAPVVRWGRSSGHMAVSLAIAMGAVRIVLLGFDMRTVEGRSHHHDDYALPCRDALYADFRRYFAGWNAAALAVGVEVLNATPGSALPEFPHVDLGDVLALPALKAAA